MQILSRFHPINNQELANDESQVHKQDFTGRDEEGRQYSLHKEKDNCCSNFWSIGRSLKKTVVSSASHFAQSTNRVATAIKDNINTKISRHQLQKGISVSYMEVYQEMISSFLNILEEEENSEVKFHSSRPGRRVFELKEFPGLIFKMDLHENDSMQSRYENMIHAQTMIRTHGLNFLVIPQAKMFSIDRNGKNYAVIVERKMDFNPHLAMQDKYFQDYAVTLEEAIRQLAIFICKSGYSDANWTNNPILNNSLDANGNRKIGLIDLEDFNSPALGLFGLKDFRKGLVRCVHADHAEMIKEIAIQHGIDVSSFEEAHARRVEEMENDRKLEAFYLSKGIIMGNEPLSVDEKTLDFPEYPERAEELKKVTQKLIKELNEQISKTSPENSIKGRRKILIETDKGEFNRLDSELIDQNKRYWDFIIDQEYQESTILGHIVKKLIHEEVIYKLEKSDGHGYVIQA